MATKNTTTQSTEDELIQAECVAMMAMFRMEDGKRDTELNGIFEREPRLLELWKAHKETEAALRDEYARIHVESCKRAGLKPRGAYKSSMGWFRAAKRRRQA